MLASTKTNLSFGRWNQVGNNKNKRPKGFFKSHIFDVFQENELVIRKFLRRFTSSLSDIDDISQETILRALHAEKNREIREPRAFLFGVARNVARKELERKSKSLIHFIEDFEGKEYSSNEVPIDEQLESKQKMLVFWEAVTTLPPQCQKVFVLKRVHGYSHKEIAKSLDISVSTVEKHAASGLKRCSEFMNKETEGDVVKLPSTRSKKNG